eukprot:5471334-Amphidinium_carterae.1
MLGFARSFRSLAACNGLLNCWYLSLCSFGLLGQSELFLQTFSVSRLGLSLVSADNLESFRSDYIDMLGASCVLL